MIREARIVGTVCFVGLSLGLIGTNTGHRVVELVGLAIAVGGMVYGALVFRAARRR